MVGPSEGLGRAERSSARRDERPETEGEERRTEEKRRKRGKRSCVRLLFVRREASSARNRGLL